MNETLQDIQNGIALIRGIAHKFAGGPKDIEHCIDRVFDNIEKLDAEIAELQGKLDNTK